MPSLEFGRKLSCAGPILSQTLNWAMTHNPVLRGIKTSPKQNFSWNMKEVALYSRTRRSRGFAANEKGFLLTFFSPKVKIKYSLGARFAGCLCFCTWTHRSPELTDANKTRTACFPERTGCTDCPNALMMLMNQKYLKFLDYKIWYQNKPT